MSKIHREGDEYELLPGGCDHRVPFRQYRGGRCVATGIAERGSDAMRPGAEVLDLTLPDESGRRRAKGHFTINAEGSVCHHRAATPEYRDGWERIFAKPGKPTTKAN